MKSQIKSVYDKAADKLEDVLIKKHITYSREEAFGGWKFSFPDLKVEGDEFPPDVVVHPYSYGGPKGLFESYCFLLDDGDVTGYMSIKDVLHHIEYQSQHLND